MGRLIWKRPSFGPAIAERQKFQISEALNKQKVVNFDGYSQLYSKINFGTLLDDYSIVSLMRHTGGNDRTVVSSVGTDWVFGLGDSKSAYWEMGTNLVNNGPPSDDQWHILSGMVKSDGSIELWRDGFLVHQGNQPNSKDYKPSLLALGGAGANDSFSNSEVAEVLLYNRGLKDAERRDLEDHLRLKWMSIGLEDFPLLVRLSSGQHPDFSYSSFADPSQAGDLRIFNKAGKNLSYEIEDWNGTNGESTLWVQVDKITPDLNLIAYWGNDSNTSAPLYRNNGSVWSNYAGVWHFSDFSDSSNNDLNVSTNGSPETSATGVTGYAIEFESESNDYLSLSNYTATTENSARSIETWIKSSQSTAGVLGWGTAGNRWNLTWNAQGTQIFTENGGGIRQGTGTIGNGQWNHLVASYPGNSADLNATRLYLNGRLIDATASSTNGTVNTGSNSELVLGGLPGGTSLLDGWLDETRISTVGRSHAWARLAYESQRIDKNFLNQSLEYLKAPLLPPDLNLTVVNGTPISFQVTSNPPATFYELNDTPPSWLSFNSATGILSGTPDSVGTLQLSVLASNGEGNSSTSLTILSKASIDPPLVSAGKVVSKSGRSVDILGEIISSGGAVCTVTIYYGKIDENETEQNWEKSLELGQHFQGIVPLSLNGLDSGDTYHYRIKANNGSTDWSGAGTFTTLPYDQGTLRINTGSDSNGLGAGWFWDKGLGEGEVNILEPTFSETLYFAPDGSAWNLTKATFSFSESLAIGSNLGNIILEGNNALSIQSDGNITIGQSLIGSLSPTNPHLNTGTFTDGYDAYYPDSTTRGNRTGQGNLGGYGGGRGPGRGISSGSFFAGGASGGGGSFGGEGGPGASGASGILYGSAGLDVLLGGSGGGLGNLGEAGAGGGALEFNATGKIIIEEGVKISLRGGTVFVHPQFGANFSGGAGSGGAIKLIGSSIENYGILDVRGGDAAGADPREPGVDYLRHAGGAGGGGRIAILSDGTILPGATIIDGGRGNVDGAPGLPGTLFIGHSKKIVAITVSGGSSTAPYYQFYDENGQIPDFSTFKLKSGISYQFISSGISSEHPFMIGESYGDYNSTLVSGGPLTGTTGRITVEIPEDYQGDLFYFCTNHEVMSRQFLISRQVTTFNVSGGNSTTPFYQFTDKDGHVPDFTYLNLVPGNIYEFVASGVSSSHPFMIGETYGDTDSALVSGGPLIGSRGKITVTIPDNYQGDLFYFCTNHSGMAEQFRITGQIITINVSGGNPNAPFYQFTDKNGQVPDFSSLNLIPGSIYEFVASGILNVHPFMIGESYGDTESSFVTGGPLTGSTGKITVAIPDDFQGDLFYFCTNHFMSQQFQFAEQVTTFTVSGGNPNAPYYQFYDENGQIPDFNSLNLIPGKTYEFVASGVSSGHPFMIGETYGDNDSILVTGSQLTGSTGKITVSIPTDYKDKLFYFCTSHSVMSQEFRLALDSSRNRYDDLILKSGTLTFDTAGSWMHSSGQKGKGKVEYKYITVDGFPHGFGVCEFEFSKLELGPEVSVVIKGENTLRLKINGDTKIGTNLTLNGKTGQYGIYSGIAGPGGWNSGRSLSNADFPASQNSVLSGMGPGGGIGYHDFPPSSAGGSHGGYGSIGANSGTYDNIYGDNNITHLVGGSGGARSGGRDADGGGGGGALSLLVEGSFTLETNATISANGGKGVSRASSSGAGGSGGAIRIEAANISNLGRIEALGGDANGSGGPGGGGRITLITEGSLVEGNYSVSGGSNVDLAEELQAADGIFSKILSPALPGLSDRNFTFEEIISDIDLGLISGLSYELSGLPQGIYLTENLKLSGSPIRAGTFLVNIRASNRFGETNDTFTINVAPDSPSVFTLAATAVGSTSALLHADVNSTGGEDVTLDFTYGTTQGNLNLKTNSSVVSISGKSAFLLTGLESNQTYFFRARVENSLTASDAGIERNFTTLLNQAPPTVEIGPASKISDNNATVSYELVSYDTSPPVITLFWGPIDQGKIDGLWESSYEIGEVTQIGIQNFIISGRQPGDTIFYRVRAKSENLSSWSQTSGNFTTVAKANVLTLPVSEQRAESVKVRGIISSTGGVDTLVKLTSPKVNQDLRAYWSFDEGEGYESFDQVGNSGVAWLRGGVTWQPSHSIDFGTAVSLEGNEFAYIELGGQQSSGVTRQDNLLGWFPFDDEAGSTSSNLGSAGSIATLKNGALFSITEKKFGASALNIPTGSTGAYAEITTPIEVGLDNVSNTYSISVWFKGLYDFTNGWRTLTRGSGTNHQIIVSNGNDRLGSFISSGGGFKDSEYDLHPETSQNSWQHLAATFDGSSTTFYLDGSNAGTVNDSAGNNIFAVGNYQGGNQRFAEYIDDFRVYGITLSEEEVSSIYNSGNGDYPAPNDSLLIGGEMSLSAWIKPRKYGEGTRPFDFGNHSGSDAFNSIILSSMDNDGNLTTGSGTYNSSTLASNLWKLNQWQHLCITIDEDGTTKFYSDNEFLNSYTGAKIPKLKRTHHIIGGNRIGTESFEPLQIPGLTLWLDAADSSTIVIDSGNEVSTWANKINSSVKMHSHGTNKPDTGESINGLNALGFDKRSTNNVEHMTAKKDGTANWTPATAGGEISGKVQNVALMMVARLDTRRRSIFPFGFGWYDHFPWDNGSVFWKHESSRPTFTMGNNGTEFVLSMIHSKALGKQLAYMNGNLVFDGPRTNDNQLGNMGTFVWPSNHGSGGLGRTGWGIDWTTGEIMVVSGTIQDTDREKIEGYLAHKWKLNSKLASSHPYKNRSPYSPQTIQLEFFDGLVDDLRVYDRAIGIDEISKIYQGDLIETQHLGGQEPRVTLFWGDEDGGQNEEINASSAYSWDAKIDLGTMKLGEFSVSLEGLETGKDYYYRFLALNDAGSSWSSGVEKFTTGNFSYSASTWLDTNLMVWLDASDINADGDYTNEPFGGIVDEWRDKSGGDRHAGNGFGPSILYRKLGDKSVLHFDGSEQFLRINDYPYSSSKSLNIEDQGTLVLVIEGSDMSPSTTIMSKGWPNDPSWVLRNDQSSLPSYGITGTSGQDVLTSPSGWKEQFQVFTFHKTPYLRSIRVNGTSIIRMLEEGFSSSAQNDDLIIGGLEQSGINEHGTFKIAEILIYDEALASDRIEKLEGYLAHKWSVEDSLTDIHPYKINPPAFENRPEILLSTPYFIGIDQDLNFTIETNRPASMFEEEGLPTGLSLSQEDGVISGKPSVRGTFNSVLHATNDAGTYSQPIQFVVTDFSPWPFELELNVTEYSSASLTENFVLYVELNESIGGFNYEQFTDEEGRDILFLSADRSSELAYELIEWNPLGTSSFWVLLPKLENDTSIYVKWGNSAVTSRPDYTSDGTVWKNHRAVWRMDGDPEYRIEDHASGQHAIARNSKLEKPKGVIGNAFYFDGIDDFLELPNTSYFAEGAKTLNISFWAQNQYESLDNYSLFHAHSSLGTHLQVQLPSATGNLEFFTGSGNLDSNSFDYTSQSAIDRWDYWVLQSDLDSGLSKIFFNGNLANEYFGITRPFGSSVDSFRIGSKRDGTEAWRGMIDEVRISDEVESPQKIGASYANQRPDGSNFISIGQVNGPPIILSSENLQAFVGKDFSSMIERFPSDEGNFTAVGLPAGLSINNVTGEISGRPVQYGQYQVTVIVQNDEGKVTKPFGMNIFDPTIFSKQMEFNCSNYSGTSTLEDFPMLIEMNGSVSGFNVRQFASSTGNDLRFFDTTGKEYPYEIETFDLAANRLVAWVKIPFLDANTSFSAYWGNPSLAEFPPAYSINGDVWSSGYRGVWHMRPTSGTSTLTDSSSYRNHLVDDFGVPRANGLAGAARQLFGQPDHYLTAPSNDSLENLALNKYSFSGWIWLDGTPEQRTNEAFYGLGYDTTPQSTYFDKPENFLALEPDGGRIIKSGPSNQGISFGNADDFKTLDLGITRSSGFMTALMTRFSPPVSASYQFRIQIGDEDFASLWIDENRSGTFPDYTTCSSDITTSQPIALDEGESYNLLLAHGVPSGSVASNLSLEVKSDNEIFADWTLIDPADPDQIKYYHLTFDGNLSDRISSVTVFQDGPTERLNLLGLKPQTTHRIPGGEAIEAEGNSSLQPASWMHLFTQVDDENDFLEIYLNGNLVAQKDLPENPFPNSTSAAPWHFGLGTLPLALDEIRVSSNSRSSDWIKAVYDNQSASSVFPHLGSIEGEESFLLPDLIFTTPAESYFELFVDATGEPLAFLASGLPGGMTINPADGNLSGTPVQAGTYTINLEAYYLDQSIAEQQITLQVTAGLPIVTLDEVISDSTPTLTLRYDVTATGGDEPSLMAVADSEDKGTNLYDWQYRLDLGKQGFGPGSFQMEGLDADQRYFVRLMATNLAGTQWTGKETIINYVPIPDDLPSSLFLWFDANDLLAENKTELLINPVGTPVDTWKNKAIKSTTSRDLSIPDSSPDSNNPVIAHDGHKGISVVEFDGNDWLQNEPNSIPTSWRNSGYSALAVCRYTEGLNGRVITSTSTNSRNWDNWLMGLHGGSMGRYYFLGWVDQGFSKDYNFHLFELVHEGQNKSSDPRAYVWNDAVPGNYYKGSPTGSNNYWFTPLNISFGAQTRQNAQIEFSNCQIGEFLLFEGELEESERLLLEGYLGQKWGVPLPSSHPWDAGRPAFGEIVSEGVTPVGFTGPTSSPIAVNLGPANLRQSTASLTGKLINPGRGILKPGEFSPQDYPGLQLWPR